MAICTQGLADEKREPSTFCWDSIDFDDSIVVGFSDGAVLRLSKMTALF